MWQLGEPEANSQELKANSDSLQFQEEKLVAAKEIGTHVRR
jgi:hypothetical protein